MSWSYEWRSIVPELRYVLGSAFIVGVTALMNYDLAYLTAVLALGYLAPGAKPLGFKQAGGFVVILFLINVFALVFTEVFLDYPMVFMPLLALLLLQLYYTDKLAKMVKLFALVSILVIPFVSIESNAIGAFVASKLVFNAFMAIVLSQLVFWVFPICEADLSYEKKANEAVKISERDRLVQAINIMLVVLPVLILFYMYNWSSGMLILIFISILSMSPELSSPKVGLVMIVANIFGGLFGIIAYKLLVMVPNFVYMILIILTVGFFFAQRVFSDRKTAGVFGSAFSTFLLILGSVTSSDDEAGEKVWVRVIQIAIAVTYVVLAFGLLNYILKRKTEQF